MWISKTALIKIWKRATRAIWGALRNPKTAAISAKRGKFMLWRFRKATWRKRSLLKAVLLKRQRTQPMNRTTQLRFPKNRPNSHPVSFFNPKKETPGEDRGPRETQPQSSSVEYTVAKDDTLQK